VEIKFTSGAWREEEIARKSRHRWNGNERQATTLTTALPTNKTTTTTTKTTTTTTNEMTISKSTAERPSFILYLFLTLICP